MFLQRRYTNGQQVLEKVLSITNHQGNWNQNHNITSHVRMAIIQKTTDDWCWWGCGEKGTLVHCWWEYKLVQPLWNNMEIPQKKKKVEIELPCDMTQPSHFWVFSQRQWKEDINKIFELICSLQHDYATKIAKIKKQPNCPSTDEWLEKMWYI